MNTATQSTSPFTTVACPSGDGTVLIMRGGRIVIRTTPAKLTETLAHVERVMS